MPTEHASPYGWLEGCLGEARTADDPGRAAMRAAMAASFEGYDTFRHAVLHRALVRHLKQDPLDVRRLLAVELGRDPGAGAALPAGRSSDDDAPDADELLSEGAREGRWPLAELVVLAGAAFDDPKSWAKLVAEGPDHPVGFFALVVARHVQSRTRLGGSGGGSADDPFPDRGKQHVVAALLDHLVAADPECGGFVGRAAGIYRTTLARIVEFVAERGADVTYPLRKLFPHHAWPPGAATGRALPADALLTSVEALHGPTLAPALAAALASTWGAPVPTTPRAGLETSAAHHQAGESFPGWSEVGLWSGVATPGGAFNPNTLQRQVSRIDDELEPYVTRQRDRLRRLLEG